MAAHKKYVLDSINGSKERREFAGSTQNKRKIGCDYSQEYTAAAAVGAHEKTPQAQNYRTNRLRTTCENLDGARTKNPV